MKRLLAQVMLLADYDNVGMGDRIKYIWNAILHFAPIKKASWNTVKDFDGDGIADWMGVVNIFKANGWEWGGNCVSVTHGGYVVVSGTNRANDNKEMYRAKAPVWE